MARKTRSTCADCGTHLNLPGATPSRKRPGFCITCRPDHTTHLMLPGAFVTFCGKPTYEINAAPDADVKAHEPLFGGNDVNCVHCMQALHDR